MQEERGFFKFLNFRYRKIIHFSLILCLLLIQLLIGGYFYNEFISNKKLAAIEQKLKEMHSLEKTYGRIQRPTDQRAAIPSKLLDYQG